MLTAHHLYKSFGIDPILVDVSFSISPGERVGLIGPNGCGKTTLLQILAGEMLPDQGAVVCALGDLHTGYLEQGFDPEPVQTLAEFLAHQAGDSSRIEDELATLSAQLAHDPGRKDLHTAYDQSLARLETAARQRSRAEAILEGLGLSGLDMDRPAQELSGGQKTRLSLARVLLDDPQLLLLDEPTNHLDIAMLEWLEDWLRCFPGAALIVSHDRAFLDNTVQRILDLEAETHTIHAYTGNYSAYLEQFLAERQHQLEAYQDQVYEIRRMKQDIAHTKQQALHVELTTTSRQPGPRRYAKKVAKKALSREKKLERYLASEQRVNKPKPSWQIKLEFDQAPHLGRDVLILENCWVGYTREQPLLTDLTLSVQAGQRIALSGPNGAGKTTLLRTIAGKIPPLQGGLRLGSSVRLGYMSQEQEVLDPDQTALEHIQKMAPFNETEARSFLHYYLFAGDDPLRPARLLSYGERARLILATLVVAGCNFLLLDEPINHLDIPSRLRFEQALANFKGTVLAVVHDRYFIERFATELWMVKDGSLERHILKVRED